MINTDDCWLFAGYVNSLGYGQLFYRTDGKRKSDYVHRASYETFVSQIPEGLVIDHLCKNRSCINPSHLEPVTARENTLRGDGVILNKIKTHCPKGHEYTPENTTQYSTIWRRCRECDKQRHKEYYAKNKSKWKEYNNK